jgi:hypothetical protein
MGGEREGKSREQVMISCELLTSKTGWRLIPSRLKVKRIELSACVTLKKKWHASLWFDLMIEVNILRCTQSTKQKRTFHLHRMGDATDLSTTPTTA